MSDPAADEPEPVTPETVTPERRPATLREVRALGHPLRLRILRLCGQRVVDAGLIEPAPVRTGESGALEKPYRSTGKSWWLESSHLDPEADLMMAPIDAFAEELREAGPDSIQTFERFTLHLSQEDLRELDRRIVARRRTRTAASSAMPLLERQEVGPRCCWPQRVNSTR